MKKTKKIIHSYFLFLGLVLVFQTLITIFKLSQTVAYQHRINSLIAQKKELDLKQEQLELNFFEYNSLTAVRNTLDPAFFPITSVVVINADQTLALNL